MVQANASVKAIPTFTPAIRRRVIPINITLPTQELYLVVDRDGVLRERSAGQMTKTATIEAIRDGQLGAVGDVFCICPSEGSCRMVTEDIARDIAESLPDAPKGDLEDFIESAIGCLSYAELARERWPMMAYSGSF
jgi:hypothetical protein